MAKPKTRLIAGIDLGSSKISTVIAHSVSEEGGLSSNLNVVGGATVGSQNSHGVVAVSDPNGEIVATDVDRVIEAASAVSLPTARELVHVIPREFVVDGEV